jgi:hypothetical protein
MTELGRELRAVDASIPGRIRQYYVLATLALLIAGAAIFFGPTGHNLSAQPAWLRGVALLVDPDGTSPCATYLPGLVLAYIFLATALGLCWFAFLGGVLPRVLAATREVAMKSVVPRSRPGLVDHGIQRQGATAPSAPIALLWLLIAITATIMALLPSQGVHLACRSLAAGPVVAGYLDGLTVLLIWGLAFSAPHPLLRVLQNRVLNTRWLSADRQQMPASPRRPSPQLQARARQKADAIPLARDLPKAEPPMPTAGPIEEDGTPVPEGIPGYPTSHELFKAMAVLWAGEVTQAARANDDYPTGFMHGRRQFYEFLAKSARKHEAAFRHSRRQNPVIGNRRQLLMDQIDMCRKALAGAQRHSSDLAPESPERRATRFEIDTLRKHIADLEDRLHGK